MKSIQLKKYLALAVATALAMSSASSFATDAGSQAVQFQATVTNSCSINTSQPSTIGLSSNVSYSAPNAFIINYVCNPGTQVQVSVDQGLNVGADSHRPGDRAMVDGNGHAMGYMLFQDADFSIPMGSGANVLNLTAVNANGTGDFVFIAATIFDANVVPAGTYTDTLTWSYSFN